MWQLYDLEVSLAGGLVDGDVAEGEPQAPAAQQGGAEEPGDDRYG
jgi:hypothetical protein